MDNNELENILQSKFSTLQHLETQDSLMPGLMERIELVTELAQPSQRLAGRDWVLIGAGLLGAMLTALTWQDLDVSRFAELGSLLPFDAFVAYEFSVSLSLVVLGVGVLLPCWWLIAED